MNVSPPATEFAQRTEFSQRTEFAQGTDEISLLALGNILLRKRRVIAVLVLVGVLLGLAAALLSRPKYRSSATFIPQESEGTASALAMAASQFGIRVPTSGSSGWSPAVYVELLHSRALLEPIALDTVILTEQANRRVAMIDLLDVDERTPSETLDAAIRVLERQISAAEVKSLGAVKVTVTTKWPSVSRAIADSLVTGVNRFNLETRKTQAAAERQFVEVQVADAEDALRQAEDRLQAHLQRNRSIGASPELTFERDRLQRAVMLRQELHTSWLKSREDARIREVRDTPVITVIETPRTPVVPQSRKVALKAGLGFVGGALIGIFAAFLGFLLARTRKASTEESKEFFQLMDQARPRFLRRQAH